MATSPVCGVAGMCSWAVLVVLCVTVCAGRQIARCGSTSVGHILHGLSGALGFSVWEEPPLRSGRLLPETEQHAVSSQHGATQQDRLLQLAFTVGHSQWLMVNGWSVKMKFSKLKF